MKTQFEVREGQKRLLFDGNRNHQVTVEKKVTGGWLVRLQDGRLCGPVVAGPTTLR